MSRKAFTLIELLVVIAIIAILAAILFPVFAQAKEAAKKTQSLSNAKQAGTSIQIYLNDSDDLFPNTNFVNGANYSWSTVVDTPADWRSNAASWVNMMGSVYPNNTYSYSKNAQIQEAAGAPTESTWAAQTAANKRLKATQFNSLTMNGFLSNYPSTSVGEVSKIPLLWYGFGKQRLEGYAGANPRLTCSGAASSACVFNPSGLPTAKSAYAGLGGATFGTGAPKAYTTYVHSSGTIYVRTDTSAKYTPLARPNTKNNLTYVDPFANYDATGIGSFFYPCGISATAPGYSCIFRPDFDYNYNNWY